MKSAMAGVVNERNIYRLRSIVLKQKGPTEIRTRDLLITSEAL